MLYEPDRKQCSLNEHAWSNDLKFPRGLRSCYLLNFISISVDYSFSMRNKEKMQMIPFSPS